MDFMRRLLLSLCIVLVGLSTATMPAEEKQEVDYEVYVNQIVRSVAKEAKERFDLICTGDGGRMPYDVQEIEVHFCARRRATIEEARQLEVACTEMLVRHINQHELIRPFLGEYPFGPNRASVAISFIQKDNSSYTDGSVAFVFQARNKLFYRREDPVTKNLMPILDEPYVEAVAIVHGDASSTK